MMSKKIIVISTTATAVLLFLGVMLFVNANTICAQTQAGCAPLLTNGVKGWAKGATVYYDVSSLPGGPTGKAQVNAVKAFNAWNTANSTNGSGVNFQPSSAQNPATFTVVVGTAGGNVAQVTPNAPSGTVISAAAEINLNNTTLFDPNVTGYSDAILKAMLHEIGHTMGLDDMPLPTPTGHCGGQSAGQSIMNAYCGTPNDSADNMPTRVKDCDNRSVTNNPQYATPTPTPTPTPGGNECRLTDGCGGCPCNNCETGCDPPDPICDWYYPPTECTTVCEIDDYGYPYNCETECYQPPPIYFCY